MKYSVNIENGIAKETLVFNGKEYVRTTKKMLASSISNDMDLNEQLENDDEVSLYVLDKVYDTLDGFLVDELLDIAESEN